MSTAPAAGKKAAIFMPTAQDRTRQGATPAMVSWGLSRSRGFLCGLEFICPVSPGLGVRAPGAAGYSPGLAPTWKFPGLHGSQAFPTDIIMERRTSRTSKSLVPFDLRPKRGHGGQALSFLPPALASGEGIWRGCSFLKIREWATER